MALQGAAGAQTRRSLGHHLLHPLILRLLVLCAPADYEAASQDKILFRSGQYEA